MKPFRLFTFAIGLCALMACTDRHSLEVDNLRCEYQSDPLAIDNTRPHLSWTLTARDKDCKQAAYQILAATEKKKLTEGKADIWDSGKINASQSPHVAFDGKELDSKTLVYWKVRVWNEKGECSAWSPTARFGIGLLHDHDWKASYIGMEQPEGKSLSPLFHKQFDCKEKGAQAMLHVNSLGYHEAYVNGKPVTDAVLTPAVSQFDKRSLAVTYDVTKLIKKGRNDIVILAGKGWYQDGLPGVVSKGPYVRAQLEQQVKGTWQTTLVTDGSWSVRKSGYETLGDWRPHRFGGECVTASELLPDYKSRTLDTCQWNAARTADIKVGTTSPQMAELNRIQATYHPQEVRQEGDSTWIYDMGTNFTGWTRILFPTLKEGQKIRLAYCDFLNDDGTFRDGLYEDFYIASGKEKEFFLNKFNYKAYRYLKIDNLKQAIAPEDIKGYLIHTDYDGNATFSCSDEDLNAIYEMIQYTLRCLTLGGYMVDCPQIERLGYGGDGNASTLTVQTLFNMAPTYHNWLTAWADCMREDGSMPHTAPNPYMAGGGPYWCGFIITATWNTYLNYGDIRLLERYYPYMQQWLGYVARHSQDGLLKPWPDTDYRWWYLGDWATPTDINQTDPASIDLVDNCFISYCLQTMSHIAQTLGKKEDAEDYAGQAETLNRKIHETFFDETSCSYSTQTQIDMIYPLLVGATPVELTTPVEEKMKEITATRFNGHLATGLVGIPVITEWAVKNRQAEFIYGMLKKRDYPGYLYMIDHGATTTWEHWNGERSHIHNCYNAIGSWFHQALAGIKRDDCHPGYEEVLIEPELISGVSWVKATKDTPYGTLSVEWKKEGGMLDMAIEIPVGCHATLCLPTSELTSTEECSVEHTGKGIQTRLSHGSYHLKATLKE